MNARSAVRLIVAAALVCLPNVAVAGIASFNLPGFFQLNPSSVSYRTTGIALLADANGQFKEAKLIDAPLGAGDRVKYLIVATNQSDERQAAGVSIKIPDLTQYLPPTPDSFDPADIFQYSTDGKSWHSDSARQAKGRIVAIRWILAAPLEPHLSASYSFLLKLTGPYSDRTGDLNAARQENLMQSLSIPVLDNVIRSLGVRALAAKPGPIPPLPGFEVPASIVQTGEGLRLVGRGSNVLYRAVGVALARRTDGSYQQTPMQKTQLKIGDDVRYTIFATNQGTSPANAGSTIEIPPSTQFMNARAVRADTLEVSDNGLRWTPSVSTNLRDDQVRAVRWVRQGSLAPGQSAAFTLELRVAGDYSDPKGDMNVARNKGSGSLRPLAEAALQSLAFSRVLLRRNEDTVAGVPLDRRIVSQILSPNRETGVIHSDVAPVATAQPDNTFLNNVQKRMHPDNVDMNFVGFVVGILGLGITGLVLVFARSKERPDKVTRELFNPGELENTRPGRPPRER